MCLKYDGVERARRGMDETSIQGAALPHAGRFATPAIDRGWGKWAMRGSNPRPHGCDPCALAN